MKRLAALLLAGVLSCTMVVSASAISTNGSKWALPSLEYAYQEGFFTEGELQKAKSPMSRLEFCKVVMRFLHIVNGENETTTQKSPFTDCNAPEVVAAYEAGIIGGIEPGIFAPNRTITREQMAIMLARTLERCGVSLQESEVSPFTDIKTLYPTSVRYIKQLYHADILSGYADGTFKPFREMTVQEAALSFANAYRYALQMRGTSAQPKTDTDTPADTADAANTTDTTTDAMESIEETTAADTDKALDAADIPAETIIEKEESNLSEDKMAQVTIAGKTLFLGMTEEELQALCGEPTRIDQTVYEQKRYIYSEEYQSYFFVTFVDGKAVEIFTPTTNFSYLQIDGGGTSADIKNVSYISAMEHSAVISGTDTDARFPLDYAGNINGFWLQTADFLQNKVLSSTLLLEQTDSLEAEILDLIQVKRVADGIAPLESNQTLSVTAKAHTKDMISNRYFAHNSKNGDSPFQRIRNAGKSFSTASEVISKQRGDVVHVYFDWIRTPSKINALKDSSMQEIGIGVSSLTKYLYVTVDLCGKAVSEK